MIVMTLIIMVGCSTAADTPPNNPWGIFTSDEFKPGGDCYLSPAVCRGYWIANPDWRLAGDTMKCTVGVTEADSVLSATIFNDSTGEILLVRGKHATEGSLEHSPWGPATPPEHFFLAVCKSSTGDTSFETPFTFFTTGDSLGYGPSFSSSNMWIFCTQK